MSIYEYNVFMLVFFYAYTNSYTIFNFFIYILYGSFIFTEAATITGMFMYNKENKKTAFNYSNE